MSAVEPHFKETPGRRKRARDNARDLDDLRTLYADDPVALAALERAVEQGKAEDRTPRYPTPGRSDRNWTTGRRGNRGAGVRRGTGSWAGRHTRGIG